ncbi:MAG TPA: HAMP domain-containing protein, partial [Gemmataceae bacterium]|nr:HAMP domain-containing protein [Gemmataceae bacterium]
MSYRAFKRLLGETSLERKCRFLFGAGILLLITASFWLYAWQTEHLAYDQTTSTCRALINQIFDKYHTPYVINWQKDKLEKELAAGGKNKKEIDQALQENAKAWDQLLQTRAEADREVAEKLGTYRYEVLREGHIDDSVDRDLFKEFINPDDPKEEISRLRPNERMLNYYGAVRAQKKCIECHSGLSTKLAENDVVVVKIRMPTKAIEDGVHLNRAFLMATALVTALLIMGGSYLIVRYVIVKPVKHLKEVSDAISAGELNVRSEIQTGDEFEDLSHAFNRMLRNLVSMQDQWRKVNTD